MQVQTSATGRSQEKIIQAAWNIVKQERFETIQMQDIAEQAGIGRATLYRYYQTKEQIYADVTYSWGLRFFERLSDSPAQPQTVPERVRWVLHAILIEAEAEPNLICAFLRCILQDGTAENHKMTDVNTLMPNLMAFALGQPADAIAPQALRILQAILLSGLISLQRKELEAETILTDMLKIADLLLGLATVRQN